MIELCKALNKLFYKLPAIIPNGTASDNAMWWIAELCDAGINGIAWDEVTSEFVMDVPMYDRRTRINHATSIKQT